jgi:hypothetical protein
MSRVSIVLAFAVAAAFVLYLTTGRGGLVVDGPVVARDLGWNLTGTAGMDAIVGGVLEYDGECLLLRGDAVRWPDRTRWDADQEAVRLDDGTLVHVGDSVSGGGGMAQEAPDRDESWADTETGRVLADCLTEKNGVVVFNADSHLDVEPGR